ncbi:MAG TPA: hypothetical protein VNA20_02080 [Frankiaceae bacterium]|nr:hypothetical protein [Frankiaceae bacterium]
MTTRTPRATRLAAALTALLVGVTGCQNREPTKPNVVVETRYLDALSKAIDAVNKTRARVVADGNAISRAAAALDDVDDAAVTGDRDTVRGRRATASTAFGKAQAATNRLGKDVRAYRTAVDGLARAPREGLDPTQNAALADVVSAARAELSQLRDYATVMAVVWGTYQKLDEVQGLWLTRSLGGWYRDQREAAGAYGVLVDRPVLAKARTSLAGADRRRLAAARLVDDQLATARGALASLLD